MRRSFVLALSLAAGSASPAFAIPVAPAITPATPLTPVAASHRFNRFDQHHRFHEYKRRHCTKVSTPNGVINRCKI